MGIETAILIASITAAVAGATTGIVSGVNSKRASNTQASRIKTEEQAERTQAAIEEEDRQRRLRITLASQDAIFAGSNVDMGTGTPSVLAGASFNSAAREGRRAGLYSDTRQSVLTAQQQDVLAAGDSAMLNGFIKAGGSLVQGALGAATIGTVPKAGVKTDPFKTGPTVGGDIWTGGIA